MTGSAAALRAHPLRFLITAWPWRSALWLLISAALMCLGVLLAVVPVYQWARVTTNAQLVFLFEGGFGLFWFVLAGLIAHQVPRILGQPVISPHPPTPLIPNRFGQRSIRWLRVIGAQVRSWRTLLSGVLFTVFGLVGAAVLVLVGLSIMLVFWQLPYSTGNLAYWLLAVPLLALEMYLWSVLALVGSAINRSVFGGTDAEFQLAEVTSSRARLADAFTAERKRIERDLHDGAQQRIVALQLKLGLAEAKLRELGLDSADATELIRQAQSDNRQVLRELRSLVRGIYPQVLTDRGLGPAIEEIASRAPIPTFVAIKIKRRLPESIETAAYFLVLEALTNACKHSGAGRIDIRAMTVAGQLHLEIIDDGSGGAVAAADGGLAGLADRAETVGGSLSISSPLGGGTTIRAVI